MSGAAKPLEVTTSPTSGVRFAVGMAIAFTTFMVVLALGCLVGLLTQPLDGNQQLSAVVIGAVAGFGVSFGMRGIRGARELGRPVVIARLDDEGLHLHEGLGVTGLPPELAWTTVPWAWITAVSHTSLDLRSVKALGGQNPFDVLRFTVADDTLLDRGPIDRSYLAVLAGWLGLTPAQARTVLVGETGDPGQRAAVAWLAAHRPDVPLVTGTTAPWSTKASPDRWSQRPRVAVVGAHGRLGRQLVDALTRRDDAPPVAIARNEAHRARLERAGAEVRMVDLAEQDAQTAAGALRGCTAVVHAAPADAGILEVVVEAARRAGVARFVLVAGRQDGAAVGTLAASGLAWTAFRPESLTDAAATGEVALGLDVSPGAVPRADLAEVVVASIRTEDAVGEVWPIAGRPPRERTVEA